VEKCNRTILKIVRIAQASGVDWRKELDEFLFQYRVTPHSVTGMSPAELLLGRKLRDKLPRLKMPVDRKTEADWQVLLRERDARAKLRLKEYADSKRCAQFSDIAEGDRVLLQQKRENKLSPQYEPEPYRVIEKEGNAIVVESSEGVTKMRNTGHMKKFVELESEVCTPKSEGEASVANIPEKDTGDSVEESHQVAPRSFEPRPVRIRQKPAWLSDYNV